MREKAVNTRTGEVYGLLLPRKTHFPRGTEYNVMFKDGWNYLSSVNLAGRDTKVLFKLLSRLDYQNWISVAQETLAEELNISQGDINRSIKKLIEHKIIERQKDPADKRRWMYRLNADLGWRGDASQWAKHQAERTPGKVISMPGVVNPESR